MNKLDKSKHEKQMNIREIRKRFENWKSYDLNNNFENLTSKISDQTNIYIPNLSFTVFF